MTSSGYQPPPRPQRVAKTDYQARSATEELEERLNYLTLACTAMWDIIKEHTSLTEQNLMERIQDLDIADGSMDGKIKPQIRNCSKCKKRLMSRSQVCQYCQTYTPYTSAFEGAN
ncbi:MAG: hypothetical protein HRU15_06985 [Planctomycetes bacterium]|nr:hypothetical protein [Planctomycetota bacterium]